jgi:hypothetical protein
MDAALHRPKKKKKKKACDQERPSLLRVLALTGSIVSKIQHRTRSLLEDTQRP